MNGKDEIVTARIPQEWATKMDEAAEAMARRIGTRFVRSDVVRMAIARYLGYTEEDAQPEQPQPTT